MAKKLVKKQNGGASNKAERVINRTTNKINRLENRAEKADQRSKNSLDMYARSAGTPNEGYWENRALSQAEKAVRLREKSDAVKSKRSQYTGEKTKNVKLAEQELKKGGSVKSKKKK